MKRYEVKVCKVVFSLTDEFDTFEEARDKGIAVRNALRASDTTYNRFEYFFEVDELEDAIDE
jgi:hypothetical protein